MIAVETWCHIFYLLSGFAAKVDVMNTDSTARAFSRL